MTNPTLWDELVSVALLGTERETAPALNCTGTLAIMLQQLKQRPAASKETTLLSAAAIVELYRRAGAVAGKYNAEALLKPCPQESSPECSQRAALLLRNIIEERNHSLLLEWLSLAKQYRKTPPPMVLPRLLELGSNDQEIGQALIASAGHRARWLAAQNNAWSYLLQAQVEDIDHTTVWETGSTPERVGALSSLRKSSPAAALALLSTTWSQEPPECRSRFLGILQTNLTMDDEEFLEEQGLNDKRKEVREEAQRLLAKLPKSRLMQRMIARVDPLIDLKRFLVYSELHVLSLPEACDKEMIRDGISLNTVNPGMGKKEDWLMQMLGVIDPEHWCQRFSLTPMKLSTIANNNKEWAQLFLRAWRKSAILHNSSAWAEALIPLVEPQGLMDCLFGDQREDFFLNALNFSNGSIQGYANTEQALLSLLSGNHKLSQHFSKLLLDVFKKELTAKNHYTNPSFRMLQPLSLRLHVSVAQEAFGGWRTDAMEFNPVRDQLDKFMSTLQTRCEMHAELSQSMGEQK
jgi:hypothetical protein